MGLRFECVSAEQYRREPSCSIWGGGDFAPRFAVGGRPSLADAYLFNMLGAYSFVRTVHVPPFGARICHA